MARINFDDQWLKDPRRKLFVKAVGDEYKADGLAVHFWLIGQQAHVKGKLVNKKLFNMLPYAKEFIQFELAEERDEGIYIKGSKTRYLWLAKRNEAAKKGGAQKSTAKAQAAKKREERKKLQRAAPSENTEESTTKHKQNAQTTTAHNPHSHSHSHSHSQLQLENNIAASQLTPTASGSPLHPLIKIWNENCGTLAKVKNSNTARDRGIAKVFKDQAPEAWVETVKRIAASNFCNGENDRGWKASFDFLIQAETWLKASEGKYDNRIPTGPRTPPNEPGRRFWS